MIGVVAVLWLILAGSLSAHATEEEFLDYINLRPRFSQQETWAVFLGTGWTRENLEQIRVWEREGKWVNPFTGRPFENVKIFAFGQPDALREGLRIITDHVEVHVLSSWEEIERYRFDFVICHSNGCSNAIDLHRAGRIRVGSFLALGADWTSKDFAPGELKGASIDFFTMEGDPIWRLPAPSWVRVTDGTPGFKFSIPFDRLWEIGKGVWNLLSKGRADPERFPVIPLKPPPGVAGPHALVDSYFQALRSWMKSKGELQEQLEEKIRQAESEDPKKEEKKARGFSPDCPWCGCPGCGDGGGPGGTPPSSSSAKSVSLAQAVQQGLVALELEGMGSPFSARVRIRKLTDEPLVLTVQPGMVLQPEGGGTQRLVAY